jgi:hypothetical protein
LFSRVAAPSSSMFFPMFVSSNLSTSTCAYVCCFNNMYVDSQSARAWCTQGINAYTLCTTHPSIAYEHTYIDTHTHTHKHTHTQTT